MPVSPLPDQEQQWAAALRTQKGRRFSKAGFTLHEEQKNILEEIQFQKTQLLQAHDKQQTSDTERRLNRMVDLRARLCVISLTLLKQQGKLTAKDIEKETKMYYTECARLVVAFSQSR